MKQTGKCKFRQFNSAKTSNCEDKPNGITRNCIRYFISRNVIKNFHTQLNISTTTLGYLISVWGFRLCLRVNRKLKGEIHDAKNKLYDSNKL